MKKLMATILTVVIFTSSLATEILAKGVTSNDVYVPYKPHVPVPTGLEDTLHFYILATIAFVLGMSVLTAVKALKMRQSLK
jgi:hypothetical protein